MPCGKKPLIKSWDKPRNLRVVTPSRYEQNESSVKAHWKDVIKSLEMSYKDDQFWESNCELVRELVGPVVFQRIAKIYDLPRESTLYKPPDSDATTPLPSEEFYTKITGGEGPRSRYTISDIELEEEEEEEEEEQGAEEETSEQWSGSTVLPSSIKESRVKSMGQSITMSKTLSKVVSKSFSRAISKSLMPSQEKLKSKSFVSKSLSTTTDEDTFTADDLLMGGMSLNRKIRFKRVKNPHFEILYCNESETDMIKWNSKYKQKAFEVSASDEFSKKAEIMSKKIAKEFYDWWVSLGNVEFKSEIKRPEDIESLFQIWFDEHASRGLMLNPKILPCVLKTIAEYIGVPEASCPKVLKKQIFLDIHGETTPPHLMAFGTSLPHKMKHIPPKNNTKAMWQSVQIPEDLRSMECVWGDVSHLTSTKAFHTWLVQRPHLPMPPYLKLLGAAGDKKQRFVVPSDYVLKDAKSELSSGDQDLALPVSKFSLELKEVLSKIMER